MKGGKKKSRVAADFQRSSTKNTQSEREREQGCGIGAIDASLPLNDSIEPTFISPATDRFSSRAVTRHAVENDAY